MAGIPLDIIQVSERTGLSQALIKRLVVQEVFPDPSKWGKWNDEVIDRWLRSRKAQLVIRANK